METLAHAFQKTTCGCVCVANGKEAEPAVDATHVD